MSHVCIIGAGVIGLSVAIKLIEEVDTWANDSEEPKVTIVSEKFSPNTTGDGAGGFWEPYELGNTPQSKVIQWGRETFRTLEKFAHSEDAGEIGAYYITGFEIFHSEVKDPFWKDMAHGFRPMTSEEISRYPGHSYGYSYTTLMAEGRKYVSWLTKRCKDLGVKFIQKKITDLSEVAEYDIIVNCCGLGARELVGDDSVHPIKGQLIKVKAPWIKHFLNADDSSLYMLVGSEHIYIGGTQEVGNYDTTPNQNETERIWRGMCKLVPSLKGAEWNGQWAGLRPGRSSVRLEAEELKLLDGRSLKIIHNYGHGGAGLTLHWGCASEMLQLISAGLHKKQSKL